jgi:hypothetical protein
MSSFDDAVAAVRSAPSAAAAQQAYDALYVPAAHARIRQEAEPVDVLVLTAGTQPYSIAISLIRHPAREVIGIVTADARPHFWDGVARAGVDRATVREVEVHKAGAAKVYLAVRDAVARAHGRGRVVVNITSGTKAMTAGLSSAAAWLGLPQFYVESEPLAFRLFGLEVVHRVAHPLEVLGDLQRSRAEDAFNRRAWDEARRLFEDLEDARAPGAHWSARVTLCDACKAWEHLAFADAERGFLTVARRLEQARANLDREPLLDLVGSLRTLAASAGSLEAALGGPQRPPESAAATATVVRWLVSRARLFMDRQPDLSALLWYRTLEVCGQRRLAVHGVRDDAPDWSLMPDLPAKVEALGVKWDPPDKVSLLAGRVVLRAIEDPVTVGLLRVASEDRLRNLAKVRNEGPYAHGFRRAAPRDLANLRDLAWRTASATLAADGFALSEPDAAFDLPKFASAP